MYKRLFSEFYLCLRDVLCYIFYVVYIFGNWYHIFLAIICYSCCGTVNKNQDNFLKVLVTFLTFCCLNHNIMTLLVILRLVMGMGCLCQGCMPNILMEIYSFTLWKDMEQML